MSPVVPNMRVFQEPFDGSSLVELPHFVLDVLTCFERSCTFMCSSDLEECVVHPIGSVNVGSLTKVLAGPC